MTCALRQGGQLSLADPRLGRAIQWLRTHQRESGGWVTFSPHKLDRMASFAGISYAIRAQPPATKSPIPDRPPIQPRLASVSRVPWPLFS